MPPGDSLHHYGKCSSGFLGDGSVYTGTPSGLWAWPDGAGCTQCNVRTQVRVDVRLQGLPTPSGPLRTPREALKARNLAGAAVWPFQPRVSQARL